MSIVSFLLCVVTFLAGFILGHSAGLKDFAQVKAFLDKKRDDT